jgi:RsiW-degrading membrane proteinase PrsW (M82 family)
MMVCISGGAFLGTLLGHTIWAAIVGGLLGLAYGYWSSGRGGA